MLELTRNNGGHVAIRVRSVSHMIYEKLSLLRIKLLKIYCDPMLAIDFGVGG